jgi:Predicted sugar kinase
MKKIISDNNTKSKKIKSYLEKKLKNIKLNSNLSIVVGGDGFMLKTLKKYKNSSRIYYGINSGNYGFLMNKFSADKTIKNLSKAKNDFNLTFRNESYY